MITGNRFADLFYRPLIYASHQFAPNSHLPFFSRLVVREASLVSEPPKLMYAGHPGEHDSCPISEWGSSVSDVLSCQLVGGEHL